jgi:hypothetical protein
MKEALSYSETSVLTRATRRNISEDPFFIVTAVRTSNLTHCCTLYLHGGQTHRSYSFYISASNIWKTFFRLSVFLKWRYFWKVLSFKRNVTELNPGCGCDVITCVNQLSYCKINSMYRTIALNVVILGDVVPCSTHIDRRFCLAIGCTGFFAWMISTLKMEMIISSETSVQIRTTRCDIREDGNSKSVETWNLTEYLIVLNYLNY